MGDQATNALIAIVLGTILAVLLLIPTAAVQYRLDGRLGARDLAILVTSAIYALAIWTYTLLPMPADHTFACKGSQLRVLGSLGLIHVPGQGGPLALLREPAFLQIVLNVLLFVPLGLFGSFVWRRSSWVMWTLIGLLSSCVIELTQFVLLSARSASLKDVAANAFGALVGAVAGALLRTWMRR